MKMYIGLTDRNWYQTLMPLGLDEVNFWKPGSTPFRALETGDLFLFKLKAPEDAIVGGGFFTTYSLIPISLAWQTFGEKNGTRNEQELNERLTVFRERNHINQSYPTVGCIILSHPFFFQKADWIKKPDDWSGPIVAGKCYDPRDGSEGERVYNDVHLRLQMLGADAFQSTAQMRYGEGYAKYRLGQGAFRIVVTESYQKRCAISGEKTLPVLEAAHIVPCSENGMNTVNNGILLRSDLHTLFDKGYLTITDKHYIEVSSRLHEDFGNGKDYYRYHGKPLCVEPSSKLLMPSPENLHWHNEHVYLG